MFTLGHPSSQPGLNCATLNAGKASKWESSACNKKLGYICRRGNSTTPLPLLGKLKTHRRPSGFTYPCLDSRFLLLLRSDKNQPSFCPNHWVPYAGNCYSLERNKMMWRDALAACHKEGGDLASIHNIEEQSFVFSQSGYCKCVWPAKTPGILGMSCKEMKNPNLCFLTLSADRCALDWPERSKEPDAVRVVRSLPG